MNRFFAILLSVVMMVVVGAEELYAQSKDRSESIVHINSTRYYIHSVVKGDTVYSLMKLYDVSEKELYDANTVLKRGLKVNSNIKIPVRGVANSEMPTERKLKKTFNQHTVLKGETLYSISRRSELSVNILLEDNPTLDPAVLSVGQVLNIRKSEQGLTSELETRSGLADYHQKVNSVAPEGFVYYVVKVGDSYRSIAQGHGMSYKQILQVNNLPVGSAEPTEGAMLLVREAKNTPSVKSVDDGYESGRVSEACGADFTSLSFRDTLNVALLLPLTVRGRVMTPFAEFYEGFLMGVEDLKASGRNVVVNLYNTERDSNKLCNIVSQPKYQQSNLVVGPVFEDLLDIVLRDAESRSVPVVSPLATIEQSDSPVLFQVAPQADKRYDKIGDLLGDERRVTIIRGASTDADFEASVMGLLADSNKEYLVFDYEYEHPTSRQEREKLAEKLIEEAQELAEANGEVLEQAVIDSLSAKPSKGDLLPLLLGEIQEPSEVEVDESQVDLGVLDIAEKEDEGEAQQESETPQKRELKHTLFVLSDNEVEVDRILSALSSSYSSLIAINRGSGRNIRQEIEYRVVANPSWRRYVNIDRAVYFRNRVVVFSSYLAGRDSDLVREFDGRYGEKFGEFPTLYAYRGYDVARIFGEGVYRDISFDLGSRTYQPLQTPYRFERAEGRQSYINTNWVKEVYNTNFTKTIE